MNDLIVYLIPAGIVIFALGLLYRQLTNQLEEIHTLVNSNLTKV